jgi:transcriptional regulator with XRE-family HTH domain
MARRNHAIDLHLGARVRFARVEKKISQTMLGEQLGISFQQVQKYELGKDRISASQLMNISKALDKDISYFFEDLGTESDESRNDLADTIERRRKSRVNTGYDIKILRLLQGIDDEQVKLRLCGLMEAIVGAKTRASKAALQSSVESPAASPTNQ